ncbi:MAG: hypothetical protein U1E71_06035 [Ramlibacter sp.]|jgi:hypothetical protein
MDPIFNQILIESFGASPFKPLPGDIRHDDASSATALIAAFKRVFNCEKAREVSNVVFYWCVSTPYVHTDGKQFPSTISYIEIATGTLSGRWTSFSFLREGEEDAPGDLRHLAKNNDNLAFYSRLIREYGPMRVLYATLDDMNTSALRHEKQKRENVRDWERHLLKAYKTAHGVLPLKNRRC